MPFDATSKLRPPSPTVTSPVKAWRDLFTRRTQTGATETGYGLRSVERPDDQERADQERADQERADQEQG
ncbi:MAG: hypothetical protein OEW29_07350, partial [Acidimicrobiia bacterium]|nr:hypothetical protein [Acidimicrobiia bacterium]